MQAEAETKVVGVRSKTLRTGPAVSADGLPRERLVGRYELLHRLGHGGMATVFLGRAVGTAGFEKLVAVKLIHPHLANEPDFVEMFLDEARIAARIRHPNVVEILDLGREDDQFFMVMEYVEGDTLASLLKELRKAGELLPVSAVLQIIADACEGLAAAHDLVDPDGVPYHLVHRDVSPHNLLVGLDGRAQVMDFGIMKAAGKRSTTLTGQLRGKLPYMSPEQA
ncbi:MAG: serine/threonine protein kinase, partial [Deltaproteobacteria bacterium]|nr:serine/threonine protein kinase [Nannocystaceae bacterium]